MSLVRKAGQAGALMLFRKGWSALTSFAVMAYLARVLEKEDFGIVAISGTLISIIQTVAISGISEYLIFYKGEDEEKIVNAGFWFNLLAITVVGLVVLSVTPFWASFYRDERIENILYLLLIGFFFGVLSSVPMALFRKRLDYKPLVLIQTIFGTISNVGQFGFAFYGLGVYSLALPQAIIAPIMAGALYWRSGFCPRLEWGLRHWKGIFQYTKYVIGQRVLGKLVNEGDTLIIGRIFSIQVLGVYNLAFQFANLFTTHFLPIITNITTPVFAMNNHNRLLVGQHYHRMVRVIAFLTIPVIVGMILSGRFLVTNIYGVKWMDAVLPFQILSCFVLVRSVGSPTSGLYNAMGKPQIGWYFTVVFTPVFIVAILISAQFDNLIFVTVVVSVLRILGSFTHFILAAKLLGEKLLTTMKILSPIFMSTAVSFCIASFVPEQPDIYAVLRVVFFLVSSWTLLKYLWRRDYTIFMKDMVSMLPDKMKSFYWWLYHHPINNG